MKNIFKKLFIILVIILMVIFIYKIVNKYNIIKDVIEKRNQLNKINDYSYIIDGTKIVKKNNDIRVDMYKENQIQYYDSKENKLYRLYNDTMEKRVFENGNDHISIQIIGMDIINESVLANLFTMKISESYTEYYIVINKLEYTIDKETGLIKRIVWLDTNDIYEYTDYKLNDNVEDIIRPDIEKYNEI